MLEGGGVIVGLCGTYIHLYRSGYVHRFHHSNVIYFVV